MNQRIVKTGKKAVLIVLMLLLLAVTFAACSSAPDGAGGECKFVSERVGAVVRMDYDYKFILDGKGGGEYIHKGSSHKIKYSFTDGENIKISDRMTGIVYTGTLIDGELHLYDGNPERMDVSEFVYQKVN